MSVASPPLEIQPRDTAMFRGLYESRVMTIEQIAKLYFAGRREMARKRITKLKAAGFLTYRAKDSVCSETVVILAKAGYEQLVAAGAILDLPQLTWQKLQKRIDVGTTVLKHELLVVDAKVAFISAIASVDG